MSMERKNASTGQMYGFLSIWIKFLADFNQVKVYPSKNERFLNPLKGLFIYLSIKIFAFFNNGSLN